MSKAAAPCPELVQHLCGRMTRAELDAASLADEVVTVLTRELGATPRFAGNVRELEQCVRRVLVTGHARLEAVNQHAASDAAGHGLCSALEQCELPAEALLERYCSALYARSGSYVEVARVTGLDRRTVKKHVQRAAKAR